MVAVYLLMIGIGVLIVWLGFKIAEEVFQIALISTGAIAIAWGFAIAPTELQVLVEALSLGGLVRWRLGDRR